MHIIHYNILKFIFMVYKLGLVLVFVLPTYLCDCSYRHLWIYGCVYINYVKYRCTVISILYYLVEENNCFR